MADDFTDLEHRSAAAARDYWHAQYSKALRINDLGRAERALQLVQQYEELVKLIKATL